MQKRFSFLTTPSEKKRARTCWSAPLLFSCIYLQPEQAEAQQSADAQHDVCAAFAVLVNPSAITAINRATVNIFIVFSFRSGKSYSHADAIVRTRRIQFAEAYGFF